MAAPIHMCLAEIANDVFMMRMTFAHIVISLHKQLLPKSKSFMIWFLEVPFALLFFFISMGACHFVHTETQNDYLAEISLEERRAIESFFYLFLLKEAAAYTLFGDKPVSYDCYFETSSSDYSPFNKRSLQDNIQVRRGWKTWQKYQHLFPSRTFILKGCSYGNGVVEIVLVHRKRFVQVVNEHIENFKAVLGEAINGELLLKQYEVGDRPLFKLLKENHGLLGILLGFGKNNSMKFEEWIATVHGERKCPALLHQSQKEFHLQSVFQEVNHRKPYKYLYLPAFLAESNSSETRALRVKYRKQQKWIHDKYSHGDLLETTLQAYCD